MNDKIFLLFEQFRDIYCGRNTYNNDHEWVANMDATLAPICYEVGLDFAEQEN